MTHEWHAVLLRCKCGLDATVLEFDARADGQLCFICVCATCGEQFQLTFVYTAILESCVILDEKAAKSNPLEQYANLIANGKVN